MRGLLVGVPFNKRRAALGRKGKTNRNPSNEEKDQGSSVYVHEKASLNWCGQVEVDRRGGIKSLEGQGGCP